MCFPSDPNGAARPPAISLPVFSTMIDCAQKSIGWGSVQKLGDHAALGNGGPEVETGSKS